MYNVYLLKFKQSENTTKIVNNVELVYIPNGWMPLFEYKRRTE
jgi:hypothetical protein